MSQLSFIATAYFSISVVIIGLILYNGGGKDYRFGHFLFLFLFSPPVLVCMALGEILFGASKNPIDLIYQKLSYSEGKTPERIASEIKADGETLGWLSSWKAEACLEQMVEEESAREEQYEVGDGAWPKVVTLYYKGSPPVDADEKEESPALSFLGFRPRPI